MRFSLPRISFPRAVTAGVLGLFLLFSAGRARAQAQNQQQVPSSNARADRMVSALTQQLDLSEGQQSEVRAIISSTLEQRRALMKKAQNDEDADLQQMRRKMKKMQAQTDKKIVGVLDAEQKKTYRTVKKKQKQRAQQRRRRQGRRQGRKQPPAQRRQKVKPGQRAQRRSNADPAEAALNKLNAQLDLTDAQQAQIRTIITDQVEQAKHLRQKLADADSEQRRDLMKQVQKMQRQTKQRIEKVLTDEQVKTLRQNSMKQRKKMQRRQQGGGGNQ